jgi:ABC-2 type transport system permease protein
MPLLHATWWRMRRETVNAVRHHLVTTPLRGIAVIGTVLVVWGLLTALFLAMLDFLGQEQFLALKWRLLESLLALFFFALFFMVAISNAVLVWAGLFRTRAGIFQAALPLTDAELWWGAAAEGGFWAGWAVLVLAAPLLGVLATEASNPWTYLAAGLLSTIAFIACCMALGSLLALVVARLIPTLRRFSRVFLAMILVGIGLLGWHYVHTDHEAVTSEVLNDVIGRLHFAENPWMPPDWAKEALVAALAGRWAAWWHHLLLLVSTAAFLAVVAETLARVRLRKDLDALAGRPDDIARNVRSRPWRLPPFLPRDLALLAAKDLRIFFREPAQVMQFSLFFGMLGFYMLMLPRLGQAFRDDNWWRPAVSFLNLVAVTMALATFTGRFVYPMLSLEGRRLWVLALAPWPRQRVVTAKLVFALAIGAPVSVGLVLLSGFMLHLPLATMAFQGLVISAMVVGLCTGALGLGARLADYREDNPAKLVAGYGGTLNLLASLVYAGLLLTGAAWPLINPHSPDAWMWAAGWVVLIAVLWSTTAMRLAWRWFGKLDG